MNIVKTQSYEEMSRKAANIMSAQMIHKPDSVLGLATGSTPEGAYQILIERCQAGDLDFSEITTVNLDEYVGLSPDNPESYRYFMEDRLFSHVNMNAARVHFLNGIASDPISECARFETLIKELGGIDFQLLGMGPNGHIAFNEPSSSFARTCFKVGLTESTIEANKRFFDTAEDVPREALTMGIGTIMAARKILMLVSGSNKAEIAEEAFTGPICPEVPASILQLHPNVTVLGDVAALSWMD